MVTSQPHFLLFSRSDFTDISAGRWHFVLESVDGRSVIEASDAEPGLRRERLELLAVVRGLEALDQPSRVTLVTASRRISRGFRHGLEEWRNNRWRWERDGRWVPIKNRDLWQRVDQALRFHRVECRTWRIDAAHRPVNPPRGVVCEPPRREEAPPRWSWPQWRQRLGEAAKPLLAWPSQLGHWGAAS